MIQTGNVFDSLATLARPKITELSDKVDQYLNTVIEYIADVVAWWYEHHAIYPCLSQMALDYLSIPGTWSIQTE